MTLFCFHCLLDYNVHTFCTLFNEPLWFVGVVKDQLIVQKELQIPKGRNLYFYNFHEAMEIITLGMCMRDLYSENQL